MFTQSSKKIDSNGKRAVSVNSEKEQGILSTPSFSVSPQNLMQFGHMMGNGKVLQILQSQFTQRSDGLPMQRKEIGNTLLNDMAERFRIPGQFRSQIQKMNAPEVERHDNATGMPDKLRTAVESISGLSMDNVRVHYNSDKPSQVGAWAYTKGTDIHVGPGQEKHLPHEAWHVVQQAQGRVRPTMHMKGLGVNETEAFEHEADIMGEKLKSGTYLNYTPDQQENDRISLCNDKVLEPIISNNNLPIQMVKYVIEQRTGQRKTVDDDYVLKWGERFATPSDKPEPTEQRPIVPKPIEQQLIVPKPIIPKPIAPKPIVPIHREGVDYPRGFHSYQDFRDKTRRIAQVSRKGKIIVSGSSVTGFSYLGHKAFRKGGTPEENSDIDMGIVDPVLAESDQVDQRGFPIRRSQLRDIELSTGEVMKTKNKHKMGIRVFPQMPKRQIIERPHTPVEERHYDEYGREILQ